MQASPSVLKITFGLSLAVLTWFALIFQFVIATENTVNFFSYFTVQCNLLIALALTFSLLVPSTVVGRFASLASVQTAIARYIFIVAVVYNLVLRGLIPLEGWAYLIDNLLHVVVPILYVAYWFFFTPKQYLKWKHAAYWILFPVAYLAYSLLRGSIVNWYPYPFLNATRFGYAKVFINIGILLIVFLVTGFGMIALNRKLRNRSIGG